MNTLTARFLMIVSLAFVVAACGNDTTTTGAVVSGNVKNANGDLVYLEDVNGNIPVAVDTATVENGKVKLSAEVIPGIYRIRMDNVNSKTPALFYLDADSKIKFTLDKENPDFYTASGNEETEVINTSLSEQAKLFEEVESIRAEFSNNPDKIDSLNQLMQSKYQEASEKVKATITASRDLNPHVNTLLLNLLSPQAEGKFIAEELKLFLK